MEISDIEYKEPEKFFIIPFRKREQFLEIFMNHMKNILEDENYLILIIHQDDKRHFNRGAMKNIGFLFIKECYPYTYKDKTLIFHDIDCMPWKKNIFNYNTNKGVVKHHFGFPKDISKALGGIFTIKAGDFERVNGFPNYWSWGYEDNVLYSRITKKNIKIDYSNFRELKHPDVIMLWDGYKKYVDENYLFNKINNENGIGISNISNLSYELSEYLNRNRIIRIDVKNFAVPGIYPKLQFKIPSVSFTSIGHKNYYNKLWGRNN